MPARSTSFSNAGRNASTPRKNRPRPSTRSSRRKKRGYGKASRPAAPATWAASARCRPCVPNGWPACRVRASFPCSRKRRNAPASWLSRRNRRDSPTQTATAYSTPFRPSSSAGTASGSSATTAWARPPCSASFSANSNPRKAPSGTGHGSKSAISISSAPHGFPL